MQQSTTVRPIKLRTKACTAAATLTTTSPKPEAVDNGIHERRPIEDKRDDIPTRSLASLCWPPDPLEDGLNALNDPLNRDEPKPLLHTKSVPLRRLLAKHPHLKDLLTNISKIPNQPPRYPQEVRIRNVLGIGDGDGVPRHLSYRPGEEADKAKEQAARFRPGGVPPPSSAYVREEDRQALLEFQQLIKQILQNERRGNQPSTLMGEA
ncbi:hypothetical protein EMMF5_003531 [Cystobasidiomycetes sp. EMM_F5]